MNEHDSERVKDLLLEDGYSLTGNPKDANIVLFNTCSVRKHAEDRVFGSAGILKALKEKRPDAIFGIIGCMVEAQRDFIFRKLPYVDFLCGPADLDKIPEIIRRIKEGARHLICVEGYRSKRIPEFSKERNAGKAAYVKIMEGCSNFCSYCIVPYVRGPERSRPSKEILEEIKMLLDKGVKKITLLGQNVNSYGKSLKEKISFPELLRKTDTMIKRTCFAPSLGAESPETKLLGTRSGLAMAEKEQDVVIDFVTSHPKDARMDLFKAMAQCSSISKILHLPLQSGSNKILKKMNRGYTVERYKNLISNFRKIVKGACITTDLIVGFPGETKKDFKDTLKTVKEIQFDAAYIFKYSPRPFTAASKFKDDVTKEEKERRHRVLLEMQKKISLNKVASREQQVARKSMVYFLIGPTASGKTALSLELAQKLNAEIISCDSMCIYKGMDILTSKPAAPQRKKIRHHLIDIISPTKEFSVAQYRKLALDAVEDILRRDKTPLFVGGSGLYVKSIIDGLFPSHKKDLKFRKKQENLAKKYGNSYLYSKLKKIDPGAASKIHPNDLRRIIRVLEIYHTEKKKPSELKKCTQPIKYNIKIFGLSLDRQELYKNIENRAEEMFDKGIINEVKRLSKKKLSITAKNALGYNKVLGYLRGKYTLEEAKSLLKQNTRRFAKRQLTWFKADKRIKWITSLNEENILRAKPHK